MPHCNLEDLTPLRALIIEDCEDDFDLLVLRLRLAGFSPHVKRVETAAEIREALTQPGWQIILSDFDLPGLDGLSALDIVRSIDTDVPFFIVSGVIDEEQAVTALHAGAQDYLFKGKLGRLGSAVTRELEEATKRRKSKEQQVALERDRNILTHDRIRFIDVMSHELRTPLNIINLAAGILGRYGDRLDTSSRLERIADIKDAVARMTLIIDKVLLTSRLELRRWELRSQAFDLHRWCVEFLSNNTSEADRKDRILVEIANVPETVAMDERVVEIALQNVLSNALKYSNVDSKVDFKIHGIAPGQIEFTVTDRGIGIPEADISQVMGSFYRGSNVGEIQGTGLGLAIVKGCTDLHGGTFEIQSTQGEGTCVKMRFPDWLQLPAGQALRPVQIENQTQHAIEEVIQR